MTVAAHELVKTDIKIIDLALVLGYDSPESFTRAYQVFHGVPPSATRKTGQHEEYHRALIQVQVYGGKFKMGTKAVMRIETDRIIIRKFQNNDWKDLQEIAISNENSGFADCDHKWPTDDDGVKSACEHISKGELFWAIEVKELNKVVCFINISFVDDGQSLDIGHVINYGYINNGYDYEALKALFNYGFLQLGAERIMGFWALHDKEKVAPLLKLGMKITETNVVNKFRPEPNGTVGKFECCKLVVTREEWITTPAL